MGKKTLVRRVGDTYLPPWPDSKLKAGAYTMKFILKTRLPSKKNRLKAWSFWSKGEKFVDECFAKQGFITKEQAKAAVRKVNSKVRPNEEYKANIGEYKAQIQKQMQHYAEKFGKRGLVFPLSYCSIITRFYFKQEYKQDSINKEESVLDILVESGVIVDDNWFVVNPAQRKAALFKDEITENICEILITFNL